MNSLTFTTFLYTFDANGNVGQLVDASNGMIAVHYEYDPFGNLLVVPGPEADSNVFRFSTKYYDVETELYYYGHRYYDPVLGRWVNRDPIGEDGELNLYVFVGNSPVNKVDPKGLRAYVCFKKHKHNGFTEVNIGIPIEYNFTKFSDASIWLRSAIIASWNAAIEKKWTGIFGEYFVTTDVVRERNIVGTIGNKRPNIVYVFPDRSLLSPNAGAEVINYKIGRWPIQCDGNCAAHEAGQFMGCNDHYHTYPGIAGCFSDSNKKLLHFSRWIS